MGRSTYLTNLSHGTQEAKGKILHKDSKSAAYKKTLTTGAQSGGGKTQYIVLGTVGLLLKPHACTN